jgi:hypothetical protein
MTDLDFISGRFLDYEIPKDHRWLLKYFKTDVQVVFLRYYILFGEVRNFVDYTGCHCSRRSKFRMQDKFLRLKHAHNEAKQELTEEGMRTLNKLEMGQFRLTQLRN